MSNPFVRPSNRPQCKGTDFIPIDKNTIDTYIVRPKLVKTGKGDFDFITKDTVILDSRVNRSDVINEHSDEVGILNIIRKVRETGDKSLLNQRVPSFDNKTTEDIEDKLNAAIEAKNNYANLDPELTGGKSFEKFTENVMSEEDFNAYVDKKVQAKLAEINAGKVEGGNKDE